MAAKKTKYPSHVDKDGKIKGADGPELSQPKEPKQPEDFEKVGNAVQQCRDILKAAGCPHVVVALNKGGHAHMHLMGQTAEVSNMVSQMMSFVSSVNYVQGFNVMTMVAAAINRMISDALINGFGLSMRERPDKINNNQ